MNKTPNIKPQSGDSFTVEVLRSERPVLVEFWAPWSRPCQVMNSTVEEIRAACADKMKVVQVNADDDPELGVLYDIRSIPTLLYFMDGIPRARIVGTASKEAILSRLDMVSQEAGAGAPGLH